MSNPGAAAVSLKLKVAVEEASVVVNNGSLDNNLLRNNSNSNSSSNKRKCKVIVPLSIALSSLVRPGNSSSSSNNKDDVPRANRVNSLDRPAGSE
jgi:hypothetical protein